MLFNSWTFLLFALVVFPLYWSLRRRGQNVLLLVASYVFYGAWDWRFLSLFVASTLVDYALALRLEKTTAERTRRLLVAASCVANLGMLATFKYFDFFVGSAEGALTALGLDASLARLDIVLPIGISFYTFQTMGYTIDVYRRRLRPVRDLIDYALYVAYFPQLVAGPIERAERLLPQLQNERRVTREHLKQGGWLILWGLFKKAVIADGLAGVVNEAFGATTAPGGLTCLLAVYAFAYQIYCDFSGYSDIARGLAKLMGIDIVVNFDMPYLSRSPQEFWRRWHISLSQWLRDYLYIPLGGSRGGAWKTYRNLFLTMALGGLWHGAAWTFVLWGVFQGALLMAHRAVSRRWRPAPNPGRAKRVLQTIGMFHVTCLGWLIFRARDVTQIADFLRRIVTDLVPDALSGPLLFHVLFLAGLLWAFEAWTSGRDAPWERRSWQSGLGWAAVAGLLVGLLILSPSSTHAFIYFQF